MIEDLQNKESREPDFNSLDTGQKILRRTSQFKVPHTLSKEEGLAKLKARIAESPEQKRLPINKSRSLTYWLSAAAASVIILAGIWQFFIREPFNNVVATKGEHNEYKLPDGSLVTLNAESKISFRKTNFEKNRVLKMEGEAFFSIQKGKSFVINTPLADIKILGTSFNVFAREKVFKVSCITGKIQVTSGSQVIIITPGESVALENSGLIKFEDNHIETVANWRNGEFNYENSPLSSIFKEIERQFNVTFAVSKIDEKYFTGSFTNKNLVNTLDIVCIPLGLTYEIGTNSTILIREKPQ